jgi:hypothetical protein
LQLNADNLQLEAIGPGAAPLQLIDSSQYQMPLQEAIGPQQLTQVRSAHPPNRCPARTGDSMSFKHRAVFAQLFLVVAMHVTAAMVHDLPLAHAPPQDSFALLYLCFLFRGCASTSPPSAPLALARQATGVGVVLV